MPEKQHLAWLGNAGGTRRRMSRSKHWVPDGPISLLSGKRRKEIWGVWVRGSAGYLLLRAEEGGVW